MYAPVRHSTSWKSLSSARRSFINTPRGNARLTSLGPFSPSSTIISHRPLLTPACAPQLCNRVLRGAAQLRPLLLRERRLHVTSTWLAPHPQHNKAIPSPASGSIRSTGTKSQPPLKGNSAANASSTLPPAELNSSPKIATTHEQIYNIPNFLTATRLFAAPAIGYLIIQGDLKWALGLFVYAGVTDLIDGWVARRFKLQTVVGSVIDPMADKMLMTVMTATLAYEGLLPAYLATLILGRDITLAVAAIYYRYASLPPPKTMLRYWDFSLPSAEVKPTTVSKYNTFLQLVLIGASLALPVVTAEPWFLDALRPFGASETSPEVGLVYFQCLVAATTAWSGLSYAVLKDAVNILGTDEALKLKQGKRGRSIIGVAFGSVVLVALWLALFSDRVAEKVIKDKDQEATKAA